MEMQTVEQELRRKVDQARDYSQEFLKLKDKNPKNAEDIINTAAILYARVGDSLFRFYDHFTPNLFGQGWPMAALACFDGGYPLIARALFKHSKSLESRLGPLFKGVSGFLQKSSYKNTIRGCSERAEEKYPSLNRSRFRVLRKKKANTDPNFKFWIDFLEQGIKDGTVCEVSIVRDISNLTEEQREEEYKREILAIQEIKEATKSATRWIKYRNNWETHKRCIEPILLKYLIPNCFPNSLGF